MPKVLIAEDSGVVQRLIKLALQTDRTIEVVASVTDGEQAYLETVKHKPDVILMDYRMPKMNGAEAIKKIMSEIPTSIIVVSSAPEIKNEVLKLGAASFIDKPKELDYSVIAAKLINEIKIHSRIKPQKRTY
jgi:two-component system chemotaxis response regulator CheB